MDKVDNQWFLAKIRSYYPNFMGNYGVGTQNFEFQRRLKLDLPKGQSAFLWGARKTGKSTYLKHHFHDSVLYDLLKSDEYIRLLKEPHRFRLEVLDRSEEELAKPIIIDEVQKVPQLLDEVHWLIENSSAYFILCGSSVRKLKREGVNLLGGRAWRYEFYPLVTPEIPNFDLLHALNYGMVPSHYLAKNWRKSIKAYISDYLTEEIKAEGLARNLRSFAEFLDVSAFSNGELLNYSNIARECAIDAKTVKEYYQILVDTLLGYTILPYKNKRAREDLIATPKFYFFDIGLVNGLTKRTIGQLKGPDAGAALEHFILMELIAYRGINELDFNITFFRTQSGLEVDFILGQAEVAIEVKISDTIKSSHIRGLTEFTEQYKPKKSLVVNVDKTSRRFTEKDAQFRILSWEIFLEELWAGKII